MAAFLVLAIIGTCYIFGYYLFGGNDAMLYFGIAFLGIGSVCAIIKDLQLAKELKALRSYKIEIKGLMKEYLEPHIEAEFYDPSLAELYAERQSEKGKRVKIEVKNNGEKTLVTIYKEKENNEKESNK